MKALNCIATIFCLGAIILCFVASLQLINLQSTSILLVFNFLFFSLIFQLNGSSNKKMLILTVGNIAGFFWNLIFYYFSLAGYASFGVAFNILYTLIFPILNLMWIVPFWSLSLSFLPRKAQTIWKANIDN